MLHTLRTVRTSSRPPVPHSPQPPRLVRATPPLAWPDALQYALGVEHLFSRARDALVLVDIESDQILRWNGAAEELFGYSVDEAVGQKAEMLMPPALARLHRERMAHYRRTGAADMLLDRPLSVPALHRSGAELRVELSVTPIDLAGAPRRWALLTFRDARCQQVAELASLTTAHAEAAHHELETRLRDCKELLTDSTREIAEPLQRVRRAAERLEQLTRNGGGFDVDRLNLLTQVLGARAREAQQALQRVQVATTIHAGEFELQPERVNLVPLVTRVVSQVRAAAPLHRIKVGAPQGLTAVCDPARIEAVVSDLLQRAIRRNPRGCWIDVDLRRPLAGVAQIEIRDYGRRISERERARLLARAGPRSADRGWFIHRHVLERHGGNLHVDFPREGGMRVDVSLPTHRGKLVPRA
jgi:PAS domain S-box-containing protein